MSGQTIEVLNTDAEGRLVLADVMWYAQERFKPRFLIDLATLTGAIMVALGKEHAGLFANDDKLAEELSKAGDATGEKVWRMPLGKAYDKLIDSKTADMKNIGGRYGGAITAAQFLQRFIKDTPWAHLDVAGTAMDSARNDINPSWRPAGACACSTALWPITTSDTRGAGLFGSCPPRLVAGIKASSSLIFHNIYYANGSGGVVGARRPRSARLPAVCCAPDPDKLPGARRQYHPSPRDLAVRFRGAGFAARRAKHPAAGRECKNETVFGDHAPLPSRIRACRARSDTRWRPSCHQAGCARR